MSIQENTIKKKEKGARLFLTTSFSRAVQETKLSKEKGARLFKSILGF